MISAEAFSIKYNPIKELESFEKFLEKSTKSESDSQELIKDE